MTFLSAQLPLLASCVRSLSSRRRDDPMFLRFRFISDVSKFAHSMFDANVSCSKNITVKCPHILHPTKFISRKNITIFCILCRTNSAYRDNKDLEILTVEAAVIIFENIRDSMARSTCALIADTSAFETRITSLTSHKLPLIVTTSQRERLGIPPINSAPHVLQSRNFVHIIARIVGPFIPAGSFVPRSPRSTA
jgi:hypothetical protein